MERDEKVEKIVSVLYEWEDILSDACGYWCEPRPEQLQKPFEDLAKDILKRINEY